MFVERRGYFLAFSKSFVNEIQIDLSTSLPVYMRFGKLPYWRSRRRTWMRYASSSS